MSWEPTEEWPDAAQEGGAYRGAAEIIVARRDGLSATDRARLWWHSTPDLKYGELAHEIVLTPGYLYARRRSGTFRVRIESLAGGRIEHGRRVYAVMGGEDLVIANRGGDEFERAMDQHAEATEAGWTHADSVWIPLVAILVTLVSALSIAEEYWTGGTRLLRAGHLTAESSLGVYASLGLLLLAFLIALYFPRRVIVDRLGVTIVRGLMRGVRTTFPIEEMESVRVTPMRGKHGRLLGYRIRAHHRDRTVDIRSESVGKDRVGAKMRAEALAQRMAQTLSTKFVPAP